MSQAAEDEMSIARQSRFREPLAQLVGDFTDWVSILRRVGLRHRGEGPDDPDQDVCASDKLERFREPAKAIIIWLELCGRDADAAEVDDAMATLRKTARRFDAGELEPDLDEQTEEHLSALDLLIEAAEKRASRLEDLDAQIPHSVWQGFGDARTLHRARPPHA